MGECISKGNKRHKYIHAITDVCIYIHIYLFIFISQGSNTFKKITNHLPLLTS